MTTRTTLRRDLADLKQKVYLLGEKCIEVSDLYNSLLENFSGNMNENLTTVYNEIKKESKQLNDQCFLVLTLQQPLIKDLRFVIGSLQIVLNLEKISEQYYSTLSLIADINLLENNIKEKLLKMAEKVQELLKSALTLYLSSNLSTLQESLNAFSEIGFLHDLLYKETLKCVAKESGQKAQIEAQTLAAIRSLEKISDIISNILEQVNYIIIGRTETTSQD